MTGTPDSDPYTRPSTVPWPPILLAGVVAGAWALGHGLPLPWPGLDDMPARVIGLAAGLAGLALLAWAVATLRRHATTVLPHQAATTLVTTGPYHRLRNPIYLADVLILAGLAELTKNIWFVILALAFAVLVTWLAILPEERHLKARFGSAWDEYAQSTRRWI